MGGEREGRSWWRWEDVGEDARPSRAATYTGEAAWRPGGRGGARQSLEPSRSPPRPLLLSAGWPQTQAALLAALREHRPDGLLGFSQARLHAGALAAAAAHMTT